MSKMKGVRVGLVSTLLMASSMVSAGGSHSLNLPPGLQLPDQVMQAVQAQHQHDFHKARTALASYLQEHPGDAQALLVRSAIDAATGHWKEARKACAPLMTQMPAWVVAACLGQAAEGLASVRANLSLIQQRPETAESQMASWADSIAKELEHRLKHGQVQPRAPHPEH